MKLHIENPSDNDQVAFLLAKLESFAPLPETEKNRISQMVKSKTYRKEDYIVRAGEVSDSIAFLNRGLLRYFYIDPRGKSYTRYFCQAGNFVATSRTQGGASAYFVQAMEDTQILTLYWQDWLKLLDSHPVWGRITLSVQDYALSLAERRERSLIFDDAYTRYSRLLKEFPGIEAKVKQYDIADYLGITPVALSRIRKQKTVPDRQEP